MNIVDIEPMLAFLDDNHDEKDWMVNQYNADWIYSWLESQPTISPDGLVKQGRWKKSGMLLECQNCGETYSLSGGNDDKSWTFCPSCGALMED